MNIVLADLLPWGLPKEIDTRNGKRILRTYPLKEGDEFWKLWKLHKADLKEAGISVSNFNGNWIANWWQHPDPAVAAAAIAQRKEQEAREQKMREDTAALLDPDLELRVSEISPKMIPYQICPLRHLVRAIRTYRGALDASDTGTGKTYVALAAAIVLQRPLYVVCPKSVRPSWIRAAQHFGITDLTVCNYELLRRGNQPAVVIGGSKGKESLIWTIPTNTIIVFDECHRMKDHRTWNCELGLAALRQGYAVLGLSATGADNPLQMKFIGMLTQLFKTEKDFWTWTLENACSKGRWGMEFSGGTRELKQIHHQIFPLHGSRIRIADLGDAFPETQITAECYDVNGAGQDIDRIYDDMADELDRIEAKVQSDSNKQACILTAILRARQKAEILKVPAAVEMIQDAVEEGMSVAVFVNFDDSIEALAAKLKTDCLIRGGQSAKVREENIQSFQSLRQPRLAIVFPGPSAQDMKQAFGRVHRAVVKGGLPPIAPVSGSKPSPIILCNIRAGGVGISLHDESGSKSLQRVFFAAGTIEERVCEQFQEKLKRIDTLNDGDLSLLGERVSFTSRPASAESPVPPIINTTNAKTL